MDQAHIFQYWNELNDTQKEQLLTQVEGIDWPEVQRLIETHVKKKPDFSIPEQGVEPAPWYPYQPSKDIQPKYQKARELGEQLVRDGKVAAFCVAGGQGTRLGWDGPKGTFPATPIRGTTLFACFAEYLHNIQNRYQTTVPWYVMTSPINHEPTVAFFKEQNFFGLDPKNVMLFPQAMMPAIDAATNEVLLADKDSLALSPNGHGGSLKALYTSGAIEDMQRRGVEQISYIQVDNPIVRVVDPLFLGLHAMDGAQMSSKMLPKREPLEKLGNFCVINGKMTVIEYSDLPDELAHQRTDGGQLRFLAGSIAIHVIRRDFVETLNGRGGFSLPFHRADKKVPYINDDGQSVEPTEANAVKLETFVFDALPLCEKSIVYETSRADEFAPIKNADEPGCNDCPASSKRLQSARAAAWLEAAGVTIPRNADGEPDATIELKQTTAIYPEDVRKLNLPSKIDAGGELLL